MLTQFAFHRQKARAGGWCFVFEHFCWKWRLWRYLHAKSAGSLKPVGWSSHGTDFIVNDHFSRINHSKKLPQAAGSCQKKSGFSPGDGPWQRLGWGFRGRTFSKTWESKLQIFNSQALISPPCYAMLPIFILFSVLLCSTIMNYWYLLQLLCHWVWALEYQRITNTPCLRKIPKQTNCKPLADLREELKIFSFIWRRDQDPVSCEDSWLGLGWVWNSIRHKRLFQELNITNSSLVNTTWTSA